MNYIEHFPLLIIFILGLTIYCARCGGYWLVSHVRIDSKIEIWLSYLPGCILISLVAPLLLAGTLIEKGAALITIITMLIWRNLFLAMVLSIGFVAMMRFLVG